MPHSHNKTCSVCRVSKPVTEFHLRAKSKDGRQPKCRECSSAYIRAYYANNKDKARSYRQANATRRHAQNKEWLANNPERKQAIGRAYHARHRDHLNAQRRAARASDPEYRARINERRRVKREANIEAARAKARANYHRRKDDPQYRETSARASSAYRKRTPEMQRERCQRRRARLRGATVDRVDYAEVLRAHGRECYLCGSAIEGAIDFDHMVPLSRGGEHSFANIRPTHPSCNRRKSARTPEEYAGGVFK